MTTQLSDNPNLTRVLKFAFGCSKFIRTMSVWMSWPVKTFRWNGYSTSAGDMHIRRRVINQSKYIESNNEAGSKSKVGTSSSGSVILLGGPIDACNVRLGRCGFRCPTGMEIKLFWAPVSVKKFIGAVRSRRLNDPRHQQFSQ